MMPACSDPSSSSRSERIIPSETAPRSLRPLERAVRPAARRRGAQRRRSPRRRSSRRRRRSGAARARRRRPGRAGAGRRSDACPASSDPADAEAPRLPSASGTPRRDDALDLERGDREPLRDLVRAGRRTRRTRAARRPGPSSELREEPQVVLPELAQVGQPVAEHARSARGPRPNAKPETSSGS